MDTLNEKNKLLNENIERLNDKLDAFKGSKVLISGAAGFLGAHFCHFFSCLNDRKTP